MAGRVCLATDDWIAAGLDALVESGLAAVKILPLAERLGVTRGSFYWHFKNRGELLGRLLDTWEAKNTGAIVAAATAEGTLVDRYVALSRLWLGWSEFDPRLDAAVKEWAHSDPAVLDRLEAADEQRVAAFVKMIEPEGHTAAMARRRAHTLYRTQMGWGDGIEASAEGTGKGESSAAYFEIFLGRAPSRAEREVIMAGHRSA